MRAAVPVLLLAGNRPRPDPICIAYRTRYKALAPIGGAPMILLALRALEQSDRVSHIIVLAQEPERIREALDAPGTTFAGLGCRVLEAFSPRLAVRRPFAFGVGVVLAPAYFRIEERGELRGVSVSAFNDIRGSQRGLAIGLLNIAEELHGVQLGLINIARNKERFSVLPLVNYHP